MPRRRSYTLTMLQSEGISDQDMMDFLRMAAAFWAKTFEPPGVSSPQSPGDPRFGISCLAVRASKKRKPFPDRKKT